MRRDSRRPALLARYRAGHLWERTPRSSLTWPGYRHCRSRITLFHDTEKIRSSQDDCLCRHSSFSPFALLLSGGASLAPPRRYRASPFAASVVRAQATITLGKNFKHLHQSTDGSSLGSNGNFDLPLARRRCAPEFPTPRRSAIEMGDALSRSKPTLTRTPAALPLRFSALRTEGRA